MTKRMRGLLMILGLVLAAVWIAGPVGRTERQTSHSPAHELAEQNALRAPGTPPIQAPADSATVSLAERIGSNCTLGDMTPTGITAAYAWEVIVSIKKGDRANMAALIQSGRVVVIPQSTTARVLDSDWTKNSLRIRVLGGGALGEELWVHSAFCR